MIEVKIETTADNVDNLSAQLNLLGAEVVTWVDASDEAIYEPLPDQVILWNKVIVSAIFADISVADAIAHYLNDQQYQFQIQPVPQEDWVRSTQALSTPLQFGKRLWICPTWHAVPDPHAVNVKFDPGIAFGTGTHPTTALCLEWLDNHIQGGETIVDYGCGSGILAVAALKLGAKKALAVDHDPQALEASIQNAKINEVDSQLLVSLPENTPSQFVDILIANIISQPLIDLAKTFKKLIKPNGKIVLSGILESQMHAVMMAYQDEFDFLELNLKEGWVRLEGFRARAK